MNYNFFRIIGLVRYYSLPLLGDNEILYYVIFSLSVVACIIIPYFLGSLNFAIMISKKKYGVDIRDFGSGNAGMTNMCRTFGKKSGMITLGGDAGKAFISCLLGYLFIGRLGAFIAGLFCVLGHMFPLQYKFKGGKGVACAAVMILMTDLGSPVYYIPIVFILLLACFIFIVLGTKYVSLASIMCILVYPLILNSFEMSYMTLQAESGGLGLSGIYIMDYMFYVIISVILSILVVFMHRNNIKRLLHGEESKFSFKSSKSLESNISSFQEDTADFKSSKNKTTKGKNIK